MDDSSPAQDSSTPDNYGFDTPDALETQLSQEEETAYVDKVLNVKESKAEDKDESTKEPNGEASEKPAEKGTEKSGEGDNKPAIPPAPTPEEKPVEKPQEAPTLDTSDLWVDVQDREGKTVRITLEDGIPDDFTFKNDKGLYEVMDAIKEMRDIKASREAEIEKFNADKMEHEAASKSNQDILDGWNTEIQDLMDSGVMTAPKAPPANGTEYTAEEIEGDPALQQMNAVFDFMKTENVKRTADGKTPLRSYGTAFSLLQNSEKVKADAEATKQAEEEAKAKAELTKKRGAMVGGTSSQSGDSKGYTYRRGSAKNIYQVDTSDI